MRRSTPLALVGVLAFGALATTTPPPPTEPCAAVEGYDAVGLSGTAESFRGGAPDPSSIVDQGIGDQTGLAAASVTEFRYVVDVAPSDSANVKLTLDWVEPTQPDARGDYDLHVYDANGNVLGESTGDNLLGGAQAENVLLTDVAHCSQIVVHAKNWAGTPAADATLTTTLSNVKGAHKDTACAAEDAGAVLAAGTGESFRGGTPDPSSIVDQGVGDQTGLAAASVTEFRYALDIPSQYATGNVKITLDWDEPTQPDARGDYDLHVYDANGNSLGESTGDNLLGGAQAENVILTGVEDCFVFVVQAKNWAGTPFADATLTVAPSNLKPAA